MTGTKLEIEVYAENRVLRTLSQHKCVGCGECCRWPGQVVLYADDVETIADHLSLTKEQFLLGFCKVVWWDRDNERQFRIALVRQGQGCAFLDGSLCSIHKFKPLVCKAGPAGWSWIANPQDFWSYAKKSPSFQHPEGTTPSEESNRWFLATWDNELAVSKASSLTKLAQILQVSEEVLSRLPQSKYKEN
jgi:Fe-S-cluster containining protein